MAGNARASVRMKKGKKCGYVRAVIMAGGKGRRLKMRIEKPLLELEGKTMLERISTVLRNAGLDDILVAVTRDTPKTKEKAEKLQLKIIQTPGIGYVEDIQYLMKKFKEFLAVSADLPYLAPALIRKVLIKYEEIKQPISVVTPKQSYEKMGFIPSMVVDDLVPIGVNVVTKGKDYFYTIEGKETININAVEELERIRDERR